MPSLSKQSSRPGEEEKKKVLSVTSEAAPDKVRDKPESGAALSRGGGSKDGFSSLFSDTKTGPKEKSSSLPPRPPDYDDYWYQAEDGNWYNEYDDMGLVFADPDTSSKTSTTNDQSVPNQKVSSSDSKSDSQKQPRPKDYDDHWFQDEFGVLRNTYDERGLQFDDENEFYSEEQLVKIEEKLKNESKDIQSKVDTEKAVEHKPSVIDLLSKSNEQTKTEVTNRDTIRDTKSVADKAAIEKDRDGNWLENSRKDEASSEPPPSILAGQKETPLKKTKQKVSFDTAESSKQGRQTKSGRTPKERWLWAYNRIVQVGGVATPT